MIKVGDYLFENYKLISEPITGGMGVIYIVEDVGRKEVFALKSLLSGLLAPNKILTFKDEVSTWINLEMHHNIVQAMDVFMSKQTPYIQLEYISGGNLATKIRTETWTDSKVVDLAINICDGMCYAYDKVGLIHKDLKPTNILFDGNGVAKITDFGLSYSITSLILRPVKKEKEDVLLLTEDSQTKTHAFMGSPPYASPEHFCNIDLCDIRSDIYSFGVILYEIVSGRWPFFAENLNNFKQKHLYDEPAMLVSIEELSVVYPERFDLIIRKCMAKQPENRYPSFAALKNAITEIFPDVLGDRILYKAPHKPPSFAKPEREPLVPEKQQVLEALPLRVEALMKIGRYTEALDFLGRAIAIEPASAYFWYLQGECCHRLSDFNSAVDAFQKSVNLDPHYQPSIHGLLQCSEFLPKRAKEIYSLCKSVPQSPTTYFDYEKDQGYIFCLDSFDDAVKVYLAVDALTKERQALPCDFSMILGYWNPPRYFPYSVLIKMAKENLNEFSRNLLMGLKLPKHDTEHMYSGKFRDYLAETVAVSYRDYYVRDRLWFYDSYIKEVVWITPEIKIPKLLYKMGLNDPGIGKDLLLLIRNIFYTIFNIENKVLLGQVGLTLVMIGRVTPIENEDPDGRLSESESRKIFLNVLREDLKQINKMQEDLLSKKLREEVIEYGKQLIAYYESL